MSNTYAHKNDMKYKYFGYPPKFEDKIKLEDFYNRHNFRRGKYKYEKRIKSEKVSTKLESKHDRILMGQERYYDGDYVSHFDIVSCLDYECIMEYDADEYLDREAEPIRLKDFLKQLAT